MHTLTHSPATSTYRTRALRIIHRALEGVLHVERRLEPWFRQPLNRALREPTADLLQYLINRRRSKQRLELAEERIEPDEEETLDTVIDLFTDQMRGNFRPGAYERGGNTKTHGIVKASVTVRKDIPAYLRRGVFAEPGRQYAAWVRFAGPGPDVPADIQDVGFGSMSVKLMGVPGKKLMDEEKQTQDFICVSTPTFVTPDMHENAKLHRWSLLKMPIFYFLNLKDPHLLGFFMQALWNETLYNPLGTRYWSCVPYLIGDGQAMMYSFIPTTDRLERRIAGLPFGNPSPDYLRENMQATLARNDAHFDLCVQVQTDAHRMPIENAGVR